MTQPVITAIIPAYNEEKSIGSIILATQKYVNEVIVVDDGSQDQTREIAELAGARVISHPQNRGKGAALKTGFEQVKDTDIIVTLDGDGQHQPQDIPRLVDPIIRGEADIVNGSRYLDNKDNETPVYRRLGQTVLDKATYLNTGMNITDSQSGFRAFATYTLPAFRFNNEGFYIESEMLIDASNYGSRVKEVPINVTYKTDNIHKKNPISHGLAVLVNLLQDMEFNRPLYYFSIPGLVLIVIGLVLGLKYFGDYLDGATNSLLPTALAGMIGLGGIFFTLTGVILHSISRMIQRSIGRF